MSRVLLCLSLALCLGCGLFSGEEPGAEPAVPEDPSAAAYAETLRISELLAPMAPIAISPFYGLALLSGTAMLVDAGILPENQFLQRVQALRHPAFFVTFLVLSIFVSLARFTKLTNIFGTIAGYLEDRAALIALIILPFLLLAQTADWSGESLGEALGSAMKSILNRSNVGWEIFALACMALNYFVLMKTRFWIDVLVFLSPVPFIDGVLEAGKKTAATILAATYAISPWLALAVDLVVLAFALLIFGAVLRRSAYAHAMLVAPFFRRARGWFGRTPVQPPLVDPRAPIRLRTRLSGTELCFAVYAHKRFAPLGAKPRERLWLCKSAAGLELARVGWTGLHRTEIAPPVFARDLFACSMHAVRAAELIPPPLRDAYYVAPEAARFWLAPDYAPWLAELAERTGGEDAGDAGLRSGLSRAGRRLRESVARLGAGASDLLPAPAKDAKTNG